MAFSHSHLAGGKVPERAVKLVAEEPPTLGRRKPVVLLGEKALGKKAVHSVVKPCPKELASSEHKLRPQALDQARTEHEIFSDSLSLGQELKREGQRAEAGVIGKLAPGRRDRKTDARGIRGRFWELDAMRSKPQVTLEVKHA